MREAVEIFLDKDTSSSLPSTHEQQNGFLFFPLFPFIFLHLLSFCSIIFFYFFGSVGQGHSAVHIKSPSNVRPAVIFAFVINPCGPHWLRIFTKVGKSGFVYLSGIGN